MEETGPSRLGWTDRVFCGRGSLIVIGLALLVAVMTLAPVLRSTFYGDDAVNALLTPRLLELTHGSLWRTYLDAQRDWITGQGRFFPLSGYPVVLYYLVNGSALAYKSFLLGLILVNLLLFRLLVVRLTGSQAMGLAAVLVPALVFQVRYTDDPITSYAGLMQLVVLYALISLITLVRYIDTGKRGYLVVSAIAYAASLLTYEIGLPFFVMFFLVALLYPRRQKFVVAAKVTWPFALVAVAAIGVIVGIRLYYELPLAGGAAAGAYTPNAAPGSVLFTFAKQTSAGLPLSYHFMQGTGSVFLRQVFGFLPPGSARPLPGFLATLAAHPIQSALLCLGYGGLMTLACLGIVREQERSASSRGIPALAAVGVCLLLFPAALISLSPKYQQLVRWGIGYLPVYASYYGSAALLLAALYAALRSVSRTGARSALIGLVAATALVAGVIDYGVTDSVISGWSTDYDYPRSIEDAALKRGVLDDLPSGAPLLTTGHDWETAGYYLLYAGKEPGLLGNVRGVDRKLLASADSSSTTGRTTTHAFGAKARLYGLRDVAKGDSDGFAAFGSISSITLDSDGRITKTQFHPSRVYVSGMRKSSTNISGSDSLGRIDLNLADWRLVDSGNDWALYDARSEAATIAP